MDLLLTAPTNSDEVNMDAQNVSGANNNYVTLSSANNTISVTAQKQLSYNMYSRSVFPTKRSSFS